MNLHVIGLPHTQTTGEYLTCAYTTKLTRFCGMMRAQGCHVTLYAGEQNEADCDEHVPLLTEAERVEWFGPWDPDQLFANISWDPEHPAWQAMNERAIAAIRERAQPRDTLCLVTSTQKPVADALPELMAVEWAVGYEGILLERRVFESYAWMHWLYGKLGVDDGAAFDAVIPNFFDPADFHTGPDDGYLLFIGRLVSRKGPHVAAQLAERAGRRLVVAGPGAIEARDWRPHRSGFVRCPELTIRSRWLEHAGPVGVEERAALMAGASAVIVPTLYVEPFGGVAVEAMMSGVPVIASDWGAFTETVEEDVTGYRFRTLREGVAAVDRARELRRNPEAIRARAIERFGLETVGAQFRQHFERLQTLYGAGWYA